MATDWVQIFANCSNYREYLAQQDIDAGQKNISFLFTKSDIEALWAQGGGLDGIRVYIGLEQFEGGGSAVRLYAVGTQNETGEVHDDFEIPKSEDAETSETLLLGGRPCPYACGAANGLNE